MKMFLQVFTAFCTCMAVALLSNNIGAGLFAGLSVLSALFLLTEKFD